VGVVNARREPRLLEEHLDELGLARQVRMQALDGDEPLEAANAGETRQVHRGHPARRELGDQLEPIELAVLTLDGDELGQAIASAPIMTPPTPGA